MMSGADKDGDEEDEAQGEEGDSEDGEDDFICQPCEEAPVSVAKSPCAPTHEDRERHNASHLPYRSWCDVCVQARGKEDPNKKVKAKTEEAVPTIVMDYKTFGQNDEDENLTSIIIRDKRTTTTAGHICECKGTDDNWVVNKIVKDIEEMGYTDIILKTDGEPAIVQLATEVKNRRNKSTILQNPPAYDPAANGVAERAVQ